MKVKLTPAIVITQASDADVLFSRLAAVTEQNLEDDGLVHQSGDLYSAAPGGTTSLSMGPVVTGLGVYVEVDQPCVVLLNGNPLDVRPAGDGKGRLMYEGPVQSLTLTYTAAGSDPLQGCYAVWGRNA